MDIELVKDKIKSVKQNIFNRTFGDAEFNFGFASASPK